MQVFGPNELVEDVQKSGLCIGCGACVDLCAYYKNYKGKTVQLFPCTLTQGRCYAYCPKAEVDLDELSQKFRGRPYDGRDIGFYQKVLAARAGDHAPKGVFQGGGTASALISAALELGLIDIAALTAQNGLSPQPFLAKTPEDVVRCATSKFTAAPTLAGLNSAVRDGYEKIGVVGTPCQMTAVAQLRTNPLNKEDFKDPVALAIGLFCNWALDTKNLAAYLAEKLDIKAIRSMDIPPPPANILVVHTDDETFEFSLDEIKPLIPQTCFICTDMTSEWADLSVGMYEGETGWNTLIIRTDRGAELVDAAVGNGLLEIKDMPEAVVEHLKTAGYQKKKRSLITAQRREVINTEEGKRSALRMNPDVVSRILS